MSSQKDVLFEEIAGNEGNLGIITLNRPQALNSLNLMMVRAIHAQLKMWAESACIKAVIIRAAPGRAFCAGGDLRWVYDRHQESVSAAEFFHDEYQLNRCIFHYPKPYIALLDGITMGGGVGISIHGSHRVATDKLLFAMPETGIGFFPDVGGTYFLPRLPANMGFYLALTGARLNSEDCLALGIAQQKVASESLSLLIEAIAAQSLSDDAHAQVTQTIERFKVPKVKSSLIEYQNIIRDCFAAPNIEEIMAMLQHATNMFCKEAAQMLIKKSPTSLKVSLRALQKAKDLDFDAAMRQEYRLCQHFLQGHDFFEGIRALIIHKDQSPQWNPSTIEQLSTDAVETYFAPCGKELS